jgi:sRNA-binding protein
MRLMLSKLSLTVIRLYAMTWRNLHLVGIASVLSENEGLELVDLAGHGCGHLVRRDGHNVHAILQSHERPMYGPGVQSP